MEAPVDSAAHFSINTVSACVKPNERVYLLGLDFGSTTSSALVASATLSRSSASGRMEFCDTAIEFRSEPVFTPFIGQTIDIAKVTALIHHWLRQSGLGDTSTLNIGSETGHLNTSTIFSGGSIITGLAAQAHNAAALSKVIHLIVGDSVIATADDPCLESWLAFMGSCSALSRYHIDKPILNLDIGGGTTNAALGINGDVLETGCYLIGARHFQFVVGSYQLLAVSNCGAAILKDLKIKATIGDTLNINECEKIISFYIKALEAIVLGNTEFFSSVLAQAHTQVAIQSHDYPEPTITFSGGVGELLYQHAAGGALASTTFFGDFGIDLARAIVHSPILSANLNTEQPENKGRATVYGLTLHSTEVSGHTIFLPKPDCLPLRDLPIIAKLSLQSPNEQWQRAFSLAAKHELGACIQIKGIDALNHDKLLDETRALAQKIKAHCLANQMTNTQPLLILTEANIGKTLGNYISDWGQCMQNMIVIDEVPLRNAHFVNIGRLHQQLVPVSFFGMH